jgi:hypothetical protein
MAGGAANLGVRAIREIGHDAAVTIVALENGRMTVRTGQVRVDSPGVTIAAPVDQRMQPGLAQIPVHEQWFMWIVAGRTGRLFILDPNEAVVLSPADLGKPPRARRQVLVTAQTDLLSLWGNDRVFLRIGGMFPSGSVTSFTVDRAVCVLGVQGNLLLMALGTAFHAQVTRLGRPRVIEGRRPKIAFLAIGFGYQHRLQNQAGYQNQADQGKKQVGVLVVRLDSLHGHHLPICSGSDSSDRVREICLLEPPVPSRVTNGHRLTQLIYGSRPYHIFR